MHKLAQTLRDDMHVILTWFSQIAKKHREGWDLELDTLPEWLATLLTIVLHMLIFIGLIDIPKQFSRVHKLMSNMNIPFSADFCLNLCRHNETSNLPPWNS